MARGPNVKAEEIHTIKIRDWRFDYMFGNDMSRKHDGEYHDFRPLTVIGELIEGGKQAMRGAEVTVFASRERQLNRATSFVGKVKQAKGRYSATCEIPYDAFSMVLQAFCADRYRYVVLTVQNDYGGRLNMIMISFQHDRDEFDQGQPPL